MDADQDCTLPKAFLHKLQAFFGRSNLYYCIQSSQTMLMCAGQRSMNLSAWLAGSM